MIADTGIRHVLGIDIGSGFSKAVVCSDHKISAYAVSSSGGNYKQTAEGVVGEALDKIGLSMGDIAFTVATGYGASSVPFAQQMVTDISCQARAMHRLFASVGMVIDVGAQFSKVIKVDDSGRATNFILNEKCAGGSGKFLQVIARLLHIEIGEIGPLSLNAQNPVQFTTGCAVFSESEAVSRVAEGALIEDILAGVHKAIASKIINLVERIGSVGPCAVTGGGAKDNGLVRQIEASLGSALLVPEEPQISAAFGAALIALEKATKS